MSLIHADNFNIYGTNIGFMTNGRYSDATGSLITDPDGVSVSRVFQFVYDEGFRRAIKAPTTTIGLAARFWLNQLPSDDAMRPEVFWFGDASNRRMLFVMVNTTGSISAYVWDVSSGGFGGSFLLGTTPGPVITANAWWHLECKFDGSAKTFELRVEGVTVLSLDSSDFNGHLNNGPTIYQYGCAAHHTNTGFTFATNIKDFVAWDGLGSANNDFLGSVIVAELDPTSDVTIGGWVPSTGTTAYNILAQNPPATTPNLSANNTPPAAMEVNLSNLPSDVTSVKGLVTIVRAAKIDGGDGYLQTSLVSNGATDLGIDRPITAAQTYWEDYSELDPNTSAPWSPVAVNAATMKIDRTL